MTKKLDQQCFVHDFDKYKCFAAVIFGKQRRETNMGRVEYLDLSMEWVGFGQRECYLWITQGNQSCQCLLYVCCWLVF